jgi:hypothetical protein
MTLSHNNESTGLPPKAATPPGQLTRTRLAGWPPLQQTANDKLSIWQGHGDSHFHVGPHTWYRAAGLETSDSTRRRWSAWRLAPPTCAIPPRRCHDIGEHIMKSVISHGCDIRSYWYQRAISWIICSDIMWLIIRYWYQSRFSMKCIWYRRQYHEKIAQETGKWLWYWKKDMISYMIS